MPARQGAGCCDKLEALLAAKLVDIRHIAALSRVGGRRGGTPTVEEIENEDGIGQVDTAIIVDVEGVLAVDRDSRKQVPDDLDPIADIDEPVKI